MPSQLEKLKLLLGVEGASKDSLLELFLEMAKDIICEIRYSDYIEPQYLNTQVKIACELYNKVGAEGEIQHIENGISRFYDAADVSKSLLSQITPRVRTPFSKRLQDGV